ncbi:anti-sigma B factor antagonist [Azospirillum agricola]|uniref:STAS domain-containing protein n=1 Tax=Azospirillum agricola TaxID=1720247 RepID=UPI001AE25A16|nr:STAS domain-containing protein [Azospirillum agricola]MBP2228767.1 anti-sigma B factor antagonist [Azospirillum agricola]
MIKSQTIGPVLVLAVEAPRLDAALAVRFREEMLQHLAEEPGRVVFDFSGVTFLDSSGLGALVSVVKRVNHHCKPVLCGLQPAVRTMFALTRMDKVLQVRGTVDEAVASLAAE